jgi:predicted membrane GTPase involved in stress response
VVLVGRAKPRSTARGSQLVKELGVDVKELLLVAGQVILVVDSLDGAHGLTGTAINALLRVNIKATLTLVNAVDRALFDASTILDVHAGQTDDVGHVFSLFRP